jgi:peptide/nickel transport system permease protein|tara:strand:+ start:2390 stop:3346 length:957 start_codon:yes stop_codon:yes gene_type:complete
MTLLLAKRFVILLATLLVTSLLVFLIMEVLPGDPAALMLGVNARPDTLAALRSEMGLDQPMATRYLTWVWGLLQGDLGRSYTYDVPVSELVGERLLVSLPLALLSMTLSTVLAVPLGVLAAARRNSLIDLSIMGFSQLGVAIPNFWFALMLVLLFAVNLQWVSAGGFAGWEAGIWPALVSLALPTISLALPQAAILARVTRSSVLEVLGEDYLRTARAKGLSRSAALWRHAVRNALIPVVTIMGLQFSFLLAGTIIIENVFYLPGLGRLIFQAINQRDLIVVKDLVLLLAGAVVVVNFLVDLLYLLVDPRLRTGGDHA